MGLLARPSHRLTDTNRCYRNKACPCTTERQTGQETFALPISPKTLAAKGFIKCIQMFSSHRNIL